MPESDFLSFLRGYSTAEERAQDARAQELALQQKELDVAERKRKAQDEVRSNLTAKFALEGLSGPTEPQAPGFVGPPTPIARLRRRDEFTPEQIAVGRDMGVLIEAGEDRFGVNFDHPEVRSYMLEAVKEMAEREAKTVDARRNQVVDEKLMDAGELVTTDPQTAMRVFDEAQVMAGKSPDEIRLAHREVQAKLSTLPTLVKAINERVFLDVDGNPTPVEHASISSYSISFMRRVADGEPPDKAVQAVFSEMADDVPKAQEALGMAKNDGERLRTLNGMKGKFRTRLFGLQPFDQARVAARLRTPYDPSDPLGSLDSVAQRWTEITFPDEFGVEPESWFKKAAAGVFALLKFERPRIPDGPADKEDARKQLDRLFAPRQP